MALTSQDRLSLTLTHVVAVVAHTAEHVSLTARVGSQELAVRITRTQDLVWLRTPVGLVFMPQATAGRVLCDHVRRLMLPGTSRR